MVCSAEGAALFGSLRHGRPVARDSLPDGVLFVLARPQPRQGQTETRDQDQVSQQPISLSPSDIAVDRR